MAKIIGYAVVLVDIGNLAALDKNGVLWNAAKAADVFPSIASAQKHIGTTMALASERGYSWKPSDYKIVALREA